MIMFNAKVNEVTKMNLCKLLQRWSFMEGKLCCVYDGITAVIGVFKLPLDAQYKIIISTTAMCVHENLLREHPAFINRRNVVNTRPFFVRIMQEKLYD